MSLPVVIIGAGGHASVVADALLASGRTVLGVTTRDQVPSGPCGLPVLGDDAALASWRHEDIELANGIGSVGTEGRRQEVQARLEALGWRFTGVRHPRSVVSAHARVAEDAHLMAQCVVQPHAVVGEGCIVNTGAIVEHDVVLEGWVHVAPRAVVCGDVVVGAFSHVGAGAVIRQQVRLGARSLIGAGAAVVADFEGHGTLVGVPARAVAKGRKQQT